LMKICHVVILSVIAVLLSVVSLYQGFEPRPIEMFIALVLCSETLGKVLHG
jgi:hypothetical protein